jgi:hypothetical protein
MSLPGPLATLRTSSAYPLCANLSDPVAAVIDPVPYCLRGHDFASTSHFEMRLWQYTCYKFDHYPVTPA